MLAGVIALVAAMVFAGMGFEAWQTDRRLEAAPIAEAVIAEVHDGFRSNDYLVVDFEAASGRRVHARLDEGFWSPYPSAGDVIRIRYDPNEPTELLRDVRRGDDRGAVVIGAVAAILFLLFAVGSLAGRLPQWVIDYNRRSPRERRR
ncbi:MAG: DUF3592 domain-containing protein [Cellulomonadaceae bacterium]|nr:DUF3592 domain-containing protein [Cellulomonadaceae bacterium]